MKEFGIFPKGFAEILVIFDALEIRYETEFRADAKYPVGGCLKSIEILGRVL